MAFVDLPALVLIDDSDSESDSGLDDSLASLCEVDDDNQEVNNLEDSTDDSEDIPLLAGIPYLPDQIEEIIEVEVSTVNAEGLYMWDELPYLPDDQNEEIIEGEDQFDEHPLQLHPESDQWDTDSYYDSESDPGLDDSIISLIDDLDESLHDPVDDSVYEEKESEDMERKIKIVMNLAEIVTYGAARGALRNNNGNILDAITELCPDRSNDSYSPEDVMDKRSPEVRRPDLCGLLHPDDGLGPVQGLLSSIPNLQRLLAEWQI